MTPPAGCLDKAYPVGSLEKQNQLDACLMARKQNIYFH